MNKNLRKKLLNVVQVLLEVISELNEEQDVVNNKSNNTIFVNDGLGRKVSKETQFVIDLITSKKSLKTSEIKKEFANNFDRTIGEVSQSVELILGRLTRNSKKLIRTKQPHVRGSIYTINHNLIKKD